MKIEIHYIHDNVKQTNEKLILEHAKSVPH